MRHQASPSLGPYQYRSPGVQNTTMIAQMQGMSVEKEGEISPEHVLFSWIEEEESVFINEASTSKNPQVQSDYYTLSKRRMVETL